MATESVENLWASGPVQILAPRGELVGVMPEGLTDEDLLAMYRWMVQLRHFDTRSMLLQRQGRMGTYPPYSGQEACQVGAILPLSRTDWICPTYRDHGAMMVHGAPMLNILRYWRGDEWGSHLPGVNTLPVSIPIATQCLHAVGLAWSGKLKGTGQAAVAMFGDGATSEGDFHEAMNFAAVFKLPVIFLCQNNGYAISVPLAQQTTVPIATKAVAYGLPGVQVDGNDILAVWSVISQALARARAGEGATLIEALTYRYGPHTTADDPTRYRTGEEAQSWQQERDPIHRLYQFLCARGLWSEEAETLLQEQVKTAFATAVQEAEALPPTKPADIFDYVYPALPWFLKEQREEVLTNHAMQREGGTNA